MDWTDKTAMTLGFAKTGLTAVAVIVIVMVLIYYLITSITGAASNPEIIRWLESPISSLKVWHLLIILFFLR